MYKMEINVYTSNRLDAISTERVAIKLTEGKKIKIRMNLGLDTLFNKLAYPVYKINGNSA